MDDVAIKVSHLTLTTSDGTALHVTDYLPAVPASARILLMHGLGEHSGRYQHVAAFFCARGFAVRAYDHRGHGRSGGARGDVPHDASLLDDAVLVMQDWNTRSDPSAAPPFLLGHSMGGLFAARFAVAKLLSFSGLILSSPALALPLSAPQKLLLKILRALAPGLAVGNGLKRRYLSHDTAVVEAYRTDPLVHNKITARLLLAMLAAITVAQRDAQELQIPTLLVFAGDDHLIDANGSPAFFNKLKPGIGKMHRYEHLYHEIFNELDAQTVFADVGDWLESHMHIAAQAAPIE
jgi:alpha-beta hydrolase superfamily lysophospholipase